MLHFNGRSILLVAVVVLLVGGIWQYRRDSMAGQGAFPGATENGQFGTFGPGQGQTGMPYNPQTGMPYDPQTGMPYGQQPGMQNPQFPAQGGNFPQSQMGQPGGNVYQDPGGRFTVLVPNGWRADPANDGVVLSSGPVTAMISPYPGAFSGEQIVSTLSQQYASQWGNLQVADQGQFMVAGAPGAYMMLSGTSPRGVPSLLRLAGTVRGNQGYAIVMSAPLNDFNAAAGTLQAMEGSLSFGGGMQQ